MRVFVTGASGFIGRRLLPRLRASGHEVTALLLPGEPEDGLACNSLVRGDITQPRSLDGVFEGHAAVIHLAGAVGYGQSFERCARINRNGTQNVAAAAVRARVRRFVHMSSVSVYGRPAGVRVTEGFPLRKIGDAYGDTKIDAEQILQGFVARGDLDLTIVRPTVIYGPGDDKFLPKLVENLRSGHARLIGSGANTVDALHVDDVVTFIDRALEAPVAIGATYNLTHPSNPTWRELVTEVAAVLGVAAPHRGIPYPLAWLAAATMELGGRLSGREPRLTRYAVRVVGRQYHYSVERAQRDLGFEPRVGLLEGVRSLLSPAAGGDPL